MKVKEFMKTKKFRVVTLVVLICLVTIVIGRSFAVLTPVKSVVITSEKSSFEEKAPGSWQVTKSAKWTSPGKARITFDLETVMKTANDYTDIILALDISGSMEGDKLSRLKNDASNLIEQLFKNDRNRAAIITFESTSEIVENLTNNKDKLKEDINNLRVAGGTNYYQALKNVDKVLEGYVKEDKRDLILLFLTDGYPTENTPNEVGEYTYLKAQYPYLIINGIQYEMGNTVLEPIKKVSDNQFIADTNNLNNVLVEASTNPEKYDSFTITDYIDERYFNISGTKNINPSIGKATIEMEGDTPKVIWTIEKDTLRSGQDAKLTIDVDLNDEYLNQGGTYPTNRKERITSSIIDTPDEDVESSKTPILADNYIVKYEANAPEGCDALNIPTDEKHSVFQTVNISSMRPTCGNYQFKGWEIVTKDVTRVNNDYFIMPEEDVVLRAKWGALSLSKSMDGEISKVQTLYKVMADASVLDNIKSEFVSSETGINFGRNSSNTNGKGVYELSSTKDDEYPVYYYRGAVTNNNVKFGGFCWKIVRTTSTGGVKLIYNGLPDTEGQCTNTTGTSTQIGTSSFNSNGSPANNGYMYGDIYSYIIQSMPTWYSLVDKNISSRTMIYRGSMSNSNNYYYADNIRWDSESNSYILENTDGSEVTQTIWEGNYSDLKGKYRCASGSQTICRTVYYIGHTNNSYIYYLTISERESLADVNKEWNFSKNIRYEDGRYILEEPKVKIQKADWVTKCNTAGAGYYSCPDGSSSCEAINYHTSTSNTTITSVSMNGGETYDSLYEQAKTVKWIYGNDAEWDGTNYKISEITRIESSPLDWSTDRTNIGKGYHYTCLSTSDTCKSIYYIYYSGNSRDLYGTTLSNGVKIEQAVQDMQTNIKDSTIKGKIDIWYSSNITEYTKYLEDTVWCNDRSMSNSNGWTKDGDANNSLNYGPYVRSSKPSLACPNKNDFFTVSEENGNGALTYPVALLTSDEIRLAGGSNSRSSNSYYLYTDRYWWSLSPSNFNDVSASGFSVNSSGYLDDMDVNTFIGGVRPALSLRPGIKTDGGDGTAENPYTMELD